MTDVQKLFSEKLRDSGHSLTSARNAVFAALEQEAPQTMAELVEKLKGKVDRASAYRAIDLFEKLGIVQRLQIGWKYKLELTDVFNYHHHHISCTSCGLVAPLREDRTLEAAMHALAQEYGFKPSGHQIEIQGICAQCQNKQ